MKEMGKKKFTTNCCYFNFGFYLAFNCILLSLVKPSDAINCYTCSSWNGTNKDCHDPYNPIPEQYKINCMVPKMRHVGQFPAHFCLKITGEKLNSGETLMIRACALETMDNQCGMFRFGNDSFQGCILTCDFDGCNTGLQNHFSTIMTVIWPIIGIFLYS